MRMATEFVLFTDRKNKDSKENDGACKVTLFKGFGFTFTWSL